MAQYTVLSADEIQAIAGRYGLQITSYEPIEQGAGNSNYLLNTNCGKYILTVFEIEPARVSDMSQLMFLLEEHDYPAPRLHKMENGGVLSKFHGKPVLVKPYITGYVEAEISHEQAKQVGLALAKLHEIPAPDYLPNIHTYVDTTYPEVMSQDMDINYKFWVAQRYRYCIDNLPLQLPVGLVHGDIFFDNVLFEDDDFKAILDFEDASRIYKIFDLGMAAAGICTEGPNLDLNKVRALAAGYQEIRLLQEIEKNSLQLCIEWAAILTSTWRFWKYNIDMPDANKSDKYLQMVSIAVNSRAFPKEAFKRAVFS